jgi:hypothetical protein
VFDFVSLFLRCEDIFESVGVDVDIEERPKKGERGCRTRARCGQRMR